MWEGVADQTTGNLGSAVRFGLLESLPLPSVVTRGQAHRTDGEMQDRAERAHPGAVEGH